MADLAPDLFAFETPEAEPEHPGDRTEHDVHMLAGRARIAVWRNEGRITALRCLTADPTRKALVEAAARGIAQGKPVERSMLNTLAFADLWRELYALEAQAKRPPATTRPSWRATFSARC